MIRIIEGDATQPIGGGTKIIIHCCNDIGGWGSGFVVALSNRWKVPEASYRHWFEYKRQLVAFDYGEHSSFQTRVSFELGEANLCQVEDDVYVANIIGQKGVVGPNNPVPVVYDAIRSGVKQVQQYAELLSYKTDAVSIHMPRMGCGLAGGEWSEIEKIINEELEGIDVTVYDFPAAEPDS